MIDALVEPGALSVFDLVKIGVGPSSSHTMGPWTAMLDFVKRLEASGKLNQVVSVRVELFGSLAKTGRGHGTHVAVQMGLLGESITDTDIEQMPARLDQIRDSQRILLGGIHAISFDPKMAIINDIDRPCPVHANTMQASAIFADGSRHWETYYSIGGGFIQREGEGPKASASVKLPHPVSRGAELARWCETEQVPIWEISRRNERIWRSDAVIDATLDKLFETMIEAIYLGCHTDGILPGGLDVRRRAKGIHDRLMAGRSYSNRKEWLKQMRQTPNDLATSTSWITCFALAVNEVNASYGRIVTAPTNGACGVIPAVLFHYWCFTPGASQDDVRNFILVAGEIGCLFKKGATISAAAGGCQAEIGVSSSMAAAALTAVKGGSAGQSLMAAEIAMEHHLGLTCDPVGGLVQIPCIERNSMGAMKAITACQIALFGAPEDAKVSLDAVVGTMLETARNMDHRYKETAEGGLALRVPVNLADC